MFQTDLGIMIRNEQCRDYVRQAERDDLASRVRNVTSIPQKRFAAMAVFLLALLVRATHLASATGRNPL